MSHPVFDEQMAALDALKGRALDASETLLVKKMLGSRSNLLVAKAARLAEDNGLAQIVPELLAAFNRFFTNPGKTDPQCWAKNALSHALMRLECRDKDVYLRGLHHYQLEPTWGGRSDSAAVLRANCAHGLVACDDIDNRALLDLLLDLLVDEDKTVRVEAARAIGQIGALASPVLRLRALIPDEEPEVSAVCFGTLLSIERDEAIAFVARFLDKGDDAAGEAAFALAETHSPLALAEILKRQAYSHDPWFAAVLLRAIALTRLPEAADFLVDLIAGDKREAPMAIEALGSAAPSGELRDRVRQAVERAESSELEKAFREHLAAPRT
ncbi:MAG: HEAT repeat domain-containing protein [Terracidiphilus sp.]